MPDGTTFEIQRMSTEDGPGIRTTVFFKGCSLKCIWCHNPEGISPRPQIHWLGVRCMGCGTCLEVCPNHALSLTKKGISINREICQGCGTCAQECPSTALELLGTPWSLDDLLNEVEKDRAYFEASAGGITVSGGEPTLQPDFVAAFLKGCKDRGLHTALDTCGLCAQDTLDRLLPYTDLVLYDVKETDPAKHREFTGHGAETILQNLIHIGEVMNKDHTPKALWIRTPIIPNTTATDESIRRIGSFLAENLGDVVSRWDLCAFNNLCTDKYERLGISWRFKDCAPMTQAAMEDLARAARSAGIRPDIVHWSGATQIDDHDAPSQ